MKPMRQLLVALLLLSVQSPAYAETVMRAFAQASAPQIEGIEICVCFPWIICPCQKGSLGGQNGGGDSFLPGGDGRNYGPPPARASQAGSSGAGSPRTMIGPDGKPHTLEEVGLMNKEREYQAARDRMQFLENQIYGSLAEWPKVHKEALAANWQRVSAAHDGRLNDVGSVRSEVIDGLQNIGSGSRELDFDARDVVALHHAVARQIDNAQIGPPAKIPVVIPARNPDLTHVSEPAYVTPRDNPLWDRVHEADLLRQSAYRVAASASTYREAKLTYVSLAKTAHEGADHLIAQGEIETGLGVLDGVEALLDDVLDYDSVLDNVDRGSTFVAGMIAGAGLPSWAIAPGYEDVYARGELVGAIIALAGDATQAITGLGEIAVSDALAVGTLGARAPAAAAVNVAAVAQVASAGVQAKMHWDRLQDARSRLQERPAASEHCVNCKSGERTTSAPEHGEEVLERVKNGEIPLGDAPTKSYRDRFFEHFPEAKGKVDVVHHAIEQQVLKEWPGLFTESEIHSVGNLRGIPTGKNSGLHLRDIRIEWNKFLRERRRLGAPTRQEVIDFAKKLDDIFGSQFFPPVR